MHTVGNLKTSVAGILQGTNLNNVTNLNGAIERAVRVLSQQADAPDATGRENYMLFSGVYDYPAPETIFGGAFIDLRPQGVSRTPMQQVTKVPIEQFDLTKAITPWGYDVTFEWNAGNPVMRVSQGQSPASLVIDQMNDASTWTPGGGITALFDDFATFYQAPSSIRFDVPSAGFIEKTLSNPIDLSDYEGVGSVFLAMWLPTADMTSVTLDIGSDSSNYASVTMTEGFLGAWQAEDFYLTQFDLSTAVSTGTPDFSAIEYVKVTFTPSGAMTNVRVGDLFVSQPSAAQLLYYSSAVFSVDGVLSKTIVDDDDEIILNDASYTLLQYITAREIATQSGGLVSQIVLDRIYKVLYDPETGLLPRYRADNPSEEIRQVGNYYDGAFYGGYGSDY